MQQRPSAIAISELIGSGSGSGSGRVVVEAWSPEISPSRRLLAPAVPRVDGFRLRLLGRSGSGREADLRVGSRAPARVCR